MWEEQIARLRQEGGQREVNNKEPANETTAVRSASVQDGPVETQEDGLD